MNFHHFLSDLDTVLQAFHGSNMKRVVQLAPFSYLILWNKESHQYKGLFFSLDRRGPACACVTSSEIHALEYGFSSLPLTKKHSQTSLIGCLEQEKSNLIQHSFEHDPTFTYFRISFTFASKARLQLIFDSYPRGYFIDTANQKITSCGSKIDFSEGCSFISNPSKTHPTPPLFSLSSQEHVKKHIQQKKAEKLDQEIAKKDRKLKSITRSLEELPFREKTIPQELRQIEHHIVLLNLLWGEYSFKKREYLVCDPSTNIEHKISLRNGYTLHEEIQSWAKQGQKKKKYLMWIPQEKERLTCLKEEIVRQRLNLLHQKEADTETYCLKEGTKSENRYLKKRQEKSTPGIRKFRSSDGCLILVGGNSKMNHTLTWQIAKGEDIWLHIENSSGPHVIIRKENKEISQTAIHTAAELAAWFSLPQELKTKISSINPSPEIRFQVIYTKKKELIRRKGMKEGEAHAPQSVIKRISVSPTKHTVDTARLRQENYDGASHNTP